MFTALAAAIIGLTAHTGSDAAYAEVQSSSSPTCTDNWLNAVSGDWSTGRLPGRRTPPACIMAAGTYSVTLTGSVSIAALDLGGASGQQTLTVQGDLADGRAELDLDLADATTSVVDPSGVLDVGGGQGGNAGGTECVVGSNRCLRRAGTSGSVTIEIQAHVLAGGNLDVQTGTTAQKAHCCWPAASQPGKPSPCSEIPTGRHRCCSSPSPSSSPDRCSSWQAGNQPVTLQSEMPSGIVIASGGSVQTAGSAGTDPAASPSPPSPAVP